MGAEIVSSWRGEPKVVHVCLCDKNHLQNFGGYVIFRLMKIGLLALL